MLSAWRGAPRSVRANLVVVATFALLAVAMLTRTAVSAARIDGDVDAAINPRLAAVGADTAHLPALDRTRELADAIAVAAAPLHPSLARSGALNGEVAATLHDIRANTISIGDSVSGIDGSVVSIRAALGDLTPVLAAIARQTGDVTRDLTGVAAGTRSLLGPVRTIAGTAAGTAVTVRQVGGGVGRIRDSVRGIGVHSANIHDSAFLALADALLRRPDLAQTGNIRSRSSSSPPLPG